MLHAEIIRNEEYYGLNPTLFGYENCEKCHSYGPAMRTYWLVHYVVSGTGIFRIDSKEYSVHPGELFIAPPYTEMYYEADKKNPWSYIWIGFDATHGLPAPLPYILKLPEANNVFNAMKNCADFSEGRSAFLCSKLWELFALILGKEKHPQNDYVKIALDCIHAEYATGITVNEIASRLNIDRTYLHHLFKEKVGISPKQYLLNHRMNIAASLLKNNNASVAIASYSVGYTDSFVFSKMFKKHFGVSPSQYAHIVQKRNRNFTEYKF